MVSQGGAMPNPYMKGGKPQLLESYCCYIDILGFKKMIEQAKIDGKEKELLINLSNINKLIYRLGENNKIDGANIYLKVFTDNIIIGSPVEHEQPLFLENEFAVLMDTLLQYQLILALNGFFIRGGFTLGALHISNKVVFGSSIVEAYVLEKDASFPRIVLSETLAQRINIHNDNYCSLLNKNSIPIENSYILKDPADGKFYINYLFALLTYFYSNDDRWEKLNKHKKIVQENLIKYSEDLDTKAKYEWVGKYHNRFCKLIKADDVFKTFYSKDMEIAPELVSTQPRPLTGNGAAL